MKNSSQLGFWNLGLAFQKWSPKLLIFFVGLKNDSQSLTDLFEVPNGGSDQYLGSWAVTRLKQFSCLAKVYLFGQCQRLGNLSMLVRSTTDTERTTLQVGVGWSRLSEAVEAVKPRSELIPQVAGEIRPALQTSLVVQHVPQSLGLFCQPTLLCFSHEVYGCGSI